MKSVKVTGMITWSDNAPEWALKAWDGLILPVEDATPVDGFYLINLEDAIIALSCQKKDQARKWWKNFSLNNPHITHLHFSTNVCEDYD